MTMLTHAPGPSYRAAGPKMKRDAPAAAPTQGSKSKTIARVCGFAFTVTLMTVALAAIIALKTSIYLVRFNY